MMKMTTMLWSAALLMSSGVIAQQVEMSNASLTHIPSITQTNVSDLILSHNRIALDVCDVKALRDYATIELLDLSYNRIETLPRGALSRLTRLRTLKLRGNGLRTLDTDVFTGLTRLTSVDLEENPWVCSCSLARLVRRLNASVTPAGTDFRCLTPQNTTVLEEASLCSGRSTTASSSAQRPGPASASPPAAPQPGHASGSSTELSSADGPQSWKFLLGVVVLALGTSALLVCALKSPSWYKLLFNYRHQRLREDVEPSVFTGGRFSNFSLDTQQTEASAHETHQPFQDDDDGFIEDVYIETGDYGHHTHTTDA